MEEQEAYENLLTELKRGVSTLAVLSCLRRPQYGYSLMQELEERGAPVDAGTLYPLLRRLERQGLLESEWETSGAKPRKYYTLSDGGAALFQRLCAEWRALVAGMDAFLQEGEANDGTH